MGAVSVAEGSAVMKVLVTGGGGFLGRYLISLLESEDQQVVSYSRSRYDYLPGSVEQVVGDLTDLTALTAAMEGCNIVYHVASKAGVWGKYDEYYQTNVIGSYNVVEACKLNAIKFLIYTSTPSVIYTSGGVEGVDESAPYPNVFKSHYAKTKAIAEKYILEQNCETLKTLSLRPHLIWGPHDPHFIPRLKHKSQNGGFRLIGTGEYKVDHIYVENAAWGHYCAAKAIQEESNGAVCGRAYFLSQNEPWPIKDLINRLMIAIGESEVNRFVPIAIATAVGTLVESVYRILDIKTEPPLSRFLVDQLSTPHWFDCRASRELLSYEPTITIEQGFERLQSWYQESRSH